MHINCVIVLGKSVLAGTSSGGVVDSDEITEAWHSMIAFSRIRYRIYDRYAVGDESVLYSTVFNRAAAYN